MSSAALTSLAILKVNWDRLGRDYIENFVPFVAEALRQTTDDVVSLPDLQRSIRSQFELELPLNPLRQILRRAAKRGFLSQESGVFHRNPEQLNTLTFMEVRERVVSIYERSLLQLRDFARVEHNTEWSDDQAATAVHSFLTQDSLKFLYARAEGSVMAPAGRARGGRYVVGSFLARCRETAPQLFNDFAVLVQGHLLASAIFLPDAGRVNQRFRGTAAYLDTGLIVFAAGYAGPERQAPCEELLRLLREYGAELRCFDFTVDEVRGILDACAARLRAGRLKDAYGPSIEWFIESGRSSSDVELMAARLPEKLRSLGITAEARPEREPTFQVDEKGFEAALESAIGYRNPKARVHDVHSIACVAQQRQNQYSFQIESCGAIFVTGNATLARVTREFFQSEAPESAVALAITDYSLGNLLWLKNPTRAPDLPKKLLIADCYAALQPPEPLWKVYLAEIANLQESGTISPDEYYALRHSLTAKRALMDLTGADETAFSEGTVAEVLRVAKENLRSDLQKEVVQERGRRRLLEERETMRRESRVARAARVARVIRRVAFGTLTLLLAAGLLLTFPWTLPKWKDAWYQYATSALLVVLFAFTVASMTWGTSVWSLAQRLEVWLRKKVEHWLSQIGDGGE